MSLPTYETVIGHGDGTVEDPPTSGVTTDNPLAYVQPATPMYFIQASPPAHNVVSSAQLQQIVTVPAAIQPQSPTKYYETFRKGKPKALGILIIVASSVQIILGITHGLATPKSPSFYSGIMFWGPVIYIIAGALTIAAQKKPNTCLISGSLAMNVIAALTSTCAVIPAAVDIAYFLYRHCKAFYDSDGRSHCHYSIYQTGPLTIICIALITDALILCVSISASAFGCRSLKHASTLQQVYVFQNGTMIAMPPSTQPAMFLQAPAFPSGSIPPGGPTK